MLKPLFEFIVDPEADFQDDILLTIKALVKKKGSISEAVMVMIPCFPNLLERNKHSLGNMFDTVNKILVTGKMYFAENPEKLSTFLEMAKTCLFSEKDSVALSTGNNAEGAVLFQLILQVFEGTPALGESGIFEFILNATCERIAKAGVEKRESKLSSVLNKHLLGVFLSASIYAPE